MSAHVGAQAGWTHWAGLAVSLAACFAAAGLGSLFTEPAVGTWYAGLRKPAWTPPNWLFGPVWTLLYILMAVAAWLVWRGRGFTAETTTALSVFGAHLVLNALWSILFFGMKRPGAAFAEIILLWCSILAAALLFRRVEPTASWLLAPYLLWVTFAAALNFKVWRLNA